MAQWLIEEAIRLRGAAHARQRDPEQAAADELMGRHAELVALRGRMGG